MIKQSLIGFLQGVLRSWLERLEDINQTLPRAQRETWHQKEFHIPPLVIGLSSAVLLYGVLLVNTQMTLAQSLVLALFIMIVVSLFTVYLHRDQKDLVESDDAMALLAVIFFITLIWIKLIAVLTYMFDWLSLYATPIAIAPILTALLLNARLGMIVGFVVALVFGIVNGFSLPPAMVAALGSATAVAMVSQARSSQQVARAGLLVGLVQALVVLSLGIILEWGRFLTFKSMAWSLASGFFSAIFCLGVRPYLESLFSRLSNLSLLELAGVDHPLLKKMSMEAPGTYHHSLSVASLAEDAALGIGANGLLCRVGAYFHDIGKMVKAEYFIENQGTFGNPHDQVSPSLSKLIITSHVKEGLALAKSHKLDPQIAAFIPQHHGTSQIEYFYRKALKLEESEEDITKEEIEEESYRYPGPKPQTKEAGLVMLADSVEASSRTLEDPNHQRYKDLVNKIIQKKLFDGQLDETPLTLNDLRIVAERFTNTLLSIHHARIPYPESDDNKISVQ
ncbi:MAG: hypothetical protein KCHDKBKB_02185 [Elusimicrobia bacterium]|nr:hypothetical protein [Elusimicrobiota bacterium]